jgi:D-3-phosphoglycerate dehydrogenase
MQPSSIIVCSADLAHLPEARRMLESAGRVRYVPATAVSLRAALAEADAYFASMHVRLTAELIDHAPRLRVVSTPSTGLDHLDLAAIVRRGIAVLSLKDDRELLDRIPSTAELAWALLLACARRLPEAIDAARRGEWARDRLRGHQLAGKTLGVLGMGRLGSMVAAYGRAFRMRVLGCDLRPIELPGVERVSFDRLFAESDVVSIHIHLTEANRGLVNRDVLAGMKSGSVLVNTSRGAIVDEAALLEALQTGPLAAAGLDVVEGEWREDLDRHPLITYARNHGNLVITPHLGGVTYEAQELAYSAAARKLAAYLQCPPSADDS